MGLIDWSEMGRQPRLQCTVTTDTGETFPAYCHRPQRMEKKGNGGHFLPGYDTTYWVVVGKIDWLPPSLLGRLTDEFRRAPEFLAHVPNKNVTVHEMQRLPFP